MGTNMNNDENKQQKASDVTLSTLAEGAVPPAVTPQKGYNPLPKFNSNEVKDVNPREVVQPSESEKSVDDLGSPMVDMAMKNIDPTIERLAEESRELIKKGEEQRIEEAISSDSEASISEEAAPNEELSKPQYNLQTFDDEEDDEEDDDEDVINRKSRLPGTKFKSRLVSKETESESTEDITEEIPDVDINIDNTVAFKKKSTKSLDATYDMTPEEEEKRLEEAQEVAESMGVNEVVEDENTDSIDDSDFDEEDENPVISVPKVEIDDEDMDLLDDDDTVDTSDSVDGEEDEDDSEARREEIKASLRKDINKNIVPVKNKVDVSKFSIAKKPISSSKVINELNHNPINCADGVLYDVGKVVRMSAFTPLEIQSIDTRNVQESNYVAFMNNKLDLIYNHIVDENKPKSRDAWAKSTPNYLLNDFMFTVYKATFGNSNIITYNCPNSKCGNVYMKTRTIKSMIKFRNDDVKKKYYDILHTGSSFFETYDYKVDLRQVSDDYVFGMRAPSIYNRYIEPGLVDDKFNRKYSDLMIMITYIDSAYKIDRNTNTLIPIDMQQEHGKPVQNFKRKVKILSTIIRSLSSDQLQALALSTDDYDPGTMMSDGEYDSDVKYRFPDDVCPKCGRSIREHVAPPDQLLFTRHQLALMSKI